MQDLIFYFVSFHFVNLRVGEQDHRKEDNWPVVQAEEGRVRSKPLLIRACIARNCTRLAKYINLLVVLSFGSESPGNFAYNADVQVLSYFSEGLYPLLTLQVVFQYVLKFQLFLR